MNARSNHSYQVSIEVLEDRSLPSTLLVAPLHGLLHPSGHALGQAARVAGPGARLAHAARAHHGHVQHAPQHHARLHAVRFRAPDGGGSPSRDDSAAPGPTAFSGGDPAANDGDIPSSDPGFFPTPVSGSNDPFGGVAPGNG
jgi:hypothetical protein